MNQKYQIDWRIEWDGLKVAKSKEKYLDVAARSFNDFMADESSNGEEEQLLTGLNDIGQILIKEYGLGYQAILVAMLWKPFVYDHIDEDFVERSFEKQVIELLRGIRKIEGIDTTKTSIQAENFIQLIIGLSNDVRLVLLKLAERLSVIRKVNYYDENQRLGICKEGYLLYGPIAHRLGLYRTKTEFEELGMKYLHRDEYQYIARRLNETKRSREKYIEAFVEPLEKTLKKRGFNCEVKGRPKSIHSIWKKMRSQQVDFDEVYDLFAIRIILTGRYENEKSACWQVYSIVTDEYQPNPKRLRDWISIPKPNGYESLHTTVIGPDGKWVEVQIRSSRMDKVAEMGQAAHWMYKENVQNQSGSGWLEQFRQELTMPEGDRESDINPAKNELYSNKIFVFTPQNDLIKLSSKSTVLDFAFAVHTKVGYRCTGAKVNGKIVPIKHELNNGDQVEILTAPQQKPKTDWLSIVKTSKAKTRIKRVLKEASYQDADVGKETLKRKFEQWKIKYDVTTVHRIVSFLKMKDSLELYQAVAENKVDLQGIREFLKEKAPSEYIKEKSVQEKGIDNFIKTVSRPEDLLIIDDQLDQVDYKMAKCCNPIFGDEVFGFVTVNGGTKIHRINCPNARQMIQRYPYRILKVRWAGDSEDASKFTANILITGIDDIGILNEISQVISRDLRVNMRAMNVSTSDGFFNGKITLEVNNKTHLGAIMSKVKLVKGVLNVQRSDV